MNPDEFNYNSFMGVLNATVEDERGILIPGELMPSGNPVRADGVQKIMLQAGENARSMAEQWFESVRGTYEREKEERDHAVSTADVPDLAIGGEDPAPRERGPSVPAARSSDQTIEEELQARLAKWEERLERAEWEMDTARKDRDEARKQVAKCEAALDAIRDEG